VKDQLEDSTTSSKQWYYKHKEGKHEFLRGPFTKQEILQKLEEGIIDKNTLIRHGSGYWYPISQHLSNAHIYQKIGKSTAGSSNKKEETERDNQEWQAVKSKIQWDNLKTETKNTGIVDTKKEQKIGTSAPPVEPVPSKGNEKLTNIIDNKKAIIVACILLLAILVFFNKKTDTVKPINALPSSIPTHSLAPALPTSKSIPSALPTRKSTPPIIQLLTQPGESISPIIPSTENQQNQNIRIVKKIVDEYHKTHTYSETDLFVCSDMAIDVWNMVKTKGINSIIVVGNVHRDVIKYQEANHAWVSAEIFPGKFVALETTGGFLACPDSTVCSSDNQRYFYGWKFNNPRELKDYQEKSKRPCSAGYVLGADLRCHPMCGEDTYCTDENSVCVDGKCRGCSIGYYLGTDLRCHKL
jgi:hypothetical protein